MEYIHYLIDFVLHIDVHLAALVAQYGIWVYAILFVIVFCETGLVDSFFAWRFAAVRSRGFGRPADQRPERASFGARDGLCRRAGRCIQL